MILTLKSTKPCTLHPRAFPGEAGEWLPGTVPDLGPCIELLQALNPKLSDWWGSEGVCSV